MAQVIIVIDCANCCTRNEIEVHKDGVYVDSCSCGEYFGDSIKVKIEFLR